MVNSVDLDPTGFRRIFTYFSHEMIELQREFQKRQNTSSEKDAVVIEYDVIIQETLQRYFNRKFPGDSIEVKNVEVMPGGFSKETIMFDAIGRTLSGSFVMRRDTPVALITNGCHS